MTKKDILKGDFPVSSGGVVYISILEDKISQMKEIGSTKMGLHLNPLTGEAKINFYSEEDEDLVDLARASELEAEAEELRSKWG